MENSKCWMIFGLGLTFTVIKVFSNQFSYPLSIIIPPVTSTKSLSKPPILVINSLLHVISQLVKKLYV